MAGDPAGRGATTAGLVIENNETIRSFLRSAGCDKGHHLTPEIRDLASYLCSRSSIPYRSLRTIWSSLPTGDCPTILRLFAGSEFVFSSPKPREKSEELKERLRKLEELAERKAYAELVKDITPKNETMEPFSSYKDQIGFGLHVTLMMFTGYLAGYGAFRALFNHSAVMNAAGGILGLVVSMLIETVLFIIRTSTSQGTQSSNSTSEQKKNQ